MLNLKKGKKKNEKRNSADLYKEWLHIAHILQLKQ